MSSGQVGFLGFRAGYSFEFELQAGVKGLGLEASDGSFRG